MATLDTGNTKIKIETLYKGLNEGGIKLLDLKTFDTALKMKWIRFLIEKETNIVSILMMKMFKKIKKINWQLNINANDLLHISSGFKAGIFVCDIIRSWAEVNFKNITNQSNVEELKNQCLWLNSHIPVRVGNKPIFYDDMVDNDIIYIRDLMKTDKSFYTYTELCNKYGCNINVMQFNSVLSAIPWKGVIKELERRHVTLSESLLVVLFHANPYKKLYKSLIRQKYRQAPTCEQTWPVQFIDENTNVELPWKDIYMKTYTYQS